MAVQTRIQVRRGTVSQWNSAAATVGNGILYQGEIGYESDTGRFKIGDGSTAWSSLAYASVLPSSFVAGSGISLTPGTNGSTLTISLSDPTIQVADITDFAEGVDDRVNALLQAGTNISLSYNDNANTLTINSSLGLEEVQDAIGTYVSGVSGIAVSYNDTTGYTTISLSDPTIQASDVTDFSEAVDDRVSNLLTTGSGIGLTYNDSANTLQVAVTGIPSSLVTNFASSVNDLIDSAVSTSIVAGSGVDIVYNSGNNMLTVSSALTAGSGLSLSHSSGNYTISLSDPTIQLADVTDLSTDARNFLLTPSSNNLATLVTNETGSGNLVFSNSPQFTTSITTNSTSFNLFNTTATTVNAFGAATGVNIGAASGTTTVNNDLKVGANFSVNAAAGDVVASIFQASEGDGTDSIALVGNGTNAGLNRCLTLQSATLSTAARTITFPNSNGTVALTNNKLSIFASTTSSELAGVISDETGTGSLVFGTNPTISSGILAGTSSMNLFNTTATTVNAFGAATTLNIGHTGTTGSTTNISVGSTSSTKTVNIGTGGGAAANINIGGAAGTTTISSTAIDMGVGLGSIVNIGTACPTFFTQTVNVGTSGGESSTTNINIGTAARGTTTVNNNLVALGNLTVSGSGLVASNINNFDSQVRTSRLDQMSAPTSDVSLNSRKITNLATPTQDNDAVTKSYVDAARAGLDVKQSVRVATTEGITLSGLQTVDGVSLVVGNRVLVKDQATISSSADNGIYVVAAGSWSRATDADTDAKVTAGMFTFVEEGTANRDSGWVLTDNDPIILGTSGLNFAKFSGAGQITAGAGLVKTGTTGNTLDVGTASTSRIVVNADNIDLATVSRTNSSGSAGTTFLQTITTDSYGRVTAVASGVVQDATTSDKGIASFDTGDFSVTSGAVSIKASGVGNSQLENSAITIGSSSVSLGGTLTAFSGLTSVGSSSFVGALTGNASTATTLQTSRTINGTSFNGSADITIAFVDGGTP